MIRDVYFGDLSALADFGLYRKSAEVGSPAPKTESVDVPGADGVLDLTEYFGGVNYANRALAFEFQVRDQTGFHEAYRKVKQALHGLTMRVRLSEEPEIYYVGRVTVSAWKTNERIGEIGIDVDAEPFWYESEPTVVELDVDGELTHEFANASMRVMPVFDLGEAMNIKQGSASWSAAKGEWSNSALRLPRGGGPLTFAGTGHVKVTYTQRGL